MQAMEEETAGPMGTQGRAAMDAAVMEISSRSQWPSQLQSTAVFTVKAFRILCSIPWAETYSVEKLSFKQEEGRGSPCPDPLEKYVVHTMIFS